jgi:DNA-binding MarR family transcriptional regulator
VAGRADVSLLFDLFVTTQRVRRVLSEAMARSGMRPDEYAVYSLLFEMGPMTATEMAELLGMPLTTLLDYVRAMSAAGHIERMPHPSDGRALQLELSRAGIAAHSRAHDYWEVVRRRIEGGLDIPIDHVRMALHSLDDAAQGAAEPALRSRSRVTHLDSRGGRRIRMGSPRRAQPAGTRA